MLESSTRYFCPDLWYFSTITSELRMTENKIFEEELDNNLIDISPPSIFPHMLLPVRSYQNCLAAFGCYGHVWVKLVTSVPHTY